MGTDPNAYYFLCGMPCHTLGYDEGKPGESRKFAREGGSQVEKRRSGGVENLSLLSRSSSVRLEIQDGDPMDERLLITLTWP